MSNVWTKLEETTVSTFKRWNVVLKKFLLPNGNEKECVVKNDPKTVCVVALTKDNKFIVAKQFRPGPEKFMYELPGGHVEAGEDLAEAAKRELLEETGYVPESFQEIGSFHTCAYSSTTRTVFLAMGCQKVQDLREEDQKVVEVLTLPMESFQKHLLDGNITDGYGAYMVLDKVIWDIE